MKKALLQTDKIVTPIYGIFIYGKISPFSVPPFGAKNVLGRPMLLGFTLLLKTAGLPYSEEIAFDLNNGDMHYRNSVYQNVYEYMVPGYPRITYFNEEDSITINELYSVLAPHIEAETAKFITGARPLSDFAKFQEELKALNIEKYLQYYVDAYNNAN